MTNLTAKPGFALPVVLFITMFGILLGFGRLLVFHSQCRLRFDRQQEYEKVFAVRSALNRLQNTPDLFPIEGERDDLIALHTDSGREVKVLIHPADAIFPVEDNASHFYVNREKARDRGYGITRIDGTKYRYASSVSGDHELKRGDSDRYICLMPTNAIPGDKCRLSLDMSDTGRWSDDPFGRRYAFNVNSLCGGTNEHDLVRLILRRKRGGEILNQNVSSIDKMDVSWQPSRDGESVIYAELRTGGIAGTFSAYTQSCVDGTVLPPVECVSHVVTNTASGEGFVGQNSFGIQLVGRSLSLFQSSSPSGRFKRYDLVGNAQIPESVYFDFTNNLKTAEAGEDVLSTNMVMELEVVASSSRASASSAQFFGLTGNAQNQFNHFEVYPAFEFAIYIENKAERWRKDVPTEPRLATVVHLDMGDVRDAQCTAITYDTHGTEISGWRTGEHMAWGLIR